MRCVLIISCIMTICKRIIITCISCIILIEIICILHIVWWYMMLAHLVEIIWIIIWCIIVEIVIVVEHDSLVEMCVLYDYMIISSRSQVLISSRSITIIYKISSRNCDRLVTFRVPWLDKLRVSCYARQTCIMRRSLWGFNGHKEATFMSSLWV